MFSLLMSDGLFTSKQQRALMTKFLKPKYMKDQPGWRDNLGECPKLAFGTIEKKLPDLAERVVLLRSRVRELKQNFTDDALYAHRAFSKITMFTTLIGLLIFVVGLTLAILFRGEAPIAASAVAILVGGFAAFAAAGVGAFGLHKRYSAMFASQWAMKALETSIDVIVHDIALGASVGQPLSNHEIERLQRHLDAWLSIYTNSLTSFGDKYGSALSAISIPDVKIPVK